MIDEDAFGLWLSYSAVEDDEYGCDERSEFVRRFEGFELAARAALAALNLSGDHHLVLFGHAVYLELVDDDDLPDLLAGFRRASGALQAAGFENVAVLSHGSRWVVEGQPPRLEVEPGTPPVARVSTPSEPLRKALYVDAFCRDDEDAAGWGAGVYVDLEALESLGKQPKNAPTELCACGARFYRISALPSAPPG